MAVPALSDNEWLRSRLYACTSRANSLIRSELNAATTRMSVATEEHRIARLGGLKGFPEEEWQEFEQKWTSKGVKFIEVDIQSKDQADDAYKRLKELEAQHGPIDGIVSSGGLLHRIKPIGNDFCKCFPKLRFLTGPGAGFDNINTAALSESGVYYCNTPQAVAEPTADAASIMILATLRNIISYDRNTRKGKWKEGLALGTNPRGSTIGILGMGSIGGIVARHMHAFGAKVIYHNRNKLPKDSEHGAEYVADLGEFLGRCDVVSVHIPLSDATRHFLSKREFALFKQGARLVNTARGPVVDEEALVEALKSGQLSGAALDVFEREPEIHPWLLQADNVLLQPHTGSNTNGTFPAVFREMLQNLDSYLSIPKGQAPHNAVNKVSSDKITITVRLRGAEPGN